MSHVTVCPFTTLRFSGMPCTAPASSFSAPRRVPGSRRRRAGLSEFTVFKKFETKQRPASSTASPNFCACATSMRAVACSWSAKKSARANSGAY